LPEWWKVPREWEGETATILASGPSLTREQVDYVRGKSRVIAVNNQGIDTVVNGVVTPAFAPWADVLYAADRKWWEAHKAHALKFAGYKITIRDFHFEQVRSLQVSPQQVFDPRPTHLVTGGNSGYQALHLATHFGAKRIVLLGFDMQLGPKKERHWFGNHPGNLNVAGNFPTWLRSFNRLAPELQKMGIDVINCTTSTALKCFKRAPLEETL